MKLQILVVEDDTIKYGRIHQALVAYGVEPAGIRHSITAAQAAEALTERQFDLMLLDVNIPRRLGEEARRGQGLELLRELERGEGRRPRYIVGITAFDDVVKEFGEVFSDKLWSLVHYSDTSDRWITQLGLKVDYIDKVIRSAHFSDGVTYGTDLAILTALDTVELDAVRKLPYGWQPLRLDHDETRYWSGAVTVGGADHSVIAAAAPRMGMPASAVLASKVIHQFRPRVLVMVGICAGRAGKVELGDIIVADPTWDWGSGKIEGTSEGAKFLPEPHQLDIDPAVVSKLEELAEDEHALLKLKNEACGKKPNTQLRVHVEPLVSGAAVVADKRTFEMLLERHRGIFGLDMEAYGVAAAGLGNGKPRPITLTIKGVCDFADAKKNDDYQEFAASVSAGFLDLALPDLL